MSSPILLLMTKLPMLSLLLALLCTALTGCIPAAQIQHSGLQVALAGGESVAPGKYRPPGPQTLRVQPPQHYPYSYALWLPEGGTAQLLSYADAGAGATSGFALPTWQGDADVLVVVSARPLTFDSPGEDRAQVRTLEAVKQLVIQATAGLPAGDWGAAQQHYRVAEYAALQLDSSPSGAKVYLGGAYQGITPLHLRGLEAGDQQLRLQHEGFEAYDQYLTLQANQQAEVQVALSPLPRGVLTISSGDAAQVSIDSTAPDGRHLKVSTPFRGQLPAGAYQLAVRQLQAGEAAPLAATLATARLLVNITAGVEVTVACGVQEGHWQCHQ